MSVGGDDDTVAGSTPSSTGTHSGAAEPELVAGRYKIVRWLGGGGMGRVYEARDSELDERVALKVLRGGLTEEALERFRREVRLTRRIQHRNVARMFDIGDHAGDKFLTMELIDGDSLKRELGKPMPWQRLQTLAMQICAGLGAAHKAGVIHRDLKPDNILVERGTDRLAITDFGIARSVDDASVTNVGSVIGTPRYMAPEQLAGSAVDARTDLFALGVMLFELATGTRPWDGDNAITVAVAQATKPARKLDASRVPAWFAELIQRCIEIDPWKRPASAEEVGEALAAGAIGAALARETPTRSFRPSVPPSSSSPGIQLTGLQTVPSGAPPTELSNLTALAVLPFACAPADEYLADGVFEDLIDTLSSTATLRVRPAGVTRGRTEPDPRELGRQLEVDHVVVGSLRRIPTGLRVSARLIGVADGFQIWAHRRDCDDAAVLSVAEELCRGIASALSTRASSSTRPTDPRAVELYLRARSELRRFWGSHAHAAADLLEHALDLSPTSAPIAGALSWASVQAWVMMSEPQLFERAKKALDRGLATGHAEAYLASASFKLNTGDPIGAATDLGIALVRAPMLAQAHEVAGRILVEIDAATEARHHFETAAQLDPGRAHILSTDLARLDALEGAWDRAYQRIETIVADPDKSISQLGAIFQARFAGWRGDKDAIVKSAERFAPRMGTYASRLLEFVAQAASTGNIDAETWRMFVAKFGGTGQPLRSQLMGLQLLSELALVLGDPMLSIDTLEEADRLGLIDVVVLDKCPLYERVSAETSFRRCRDRVASRASRVLAAFRATGA
jgi:eukaryotic-like serine/threonine-protein kinase